MEQFLDVLKQIIESKIDVVLLDLDLPNQSELQICTELRKSFDTLLFEFLFSYSFTSATLSLHMLSLRTIFIDRKNLLFLGEQVF